MNRHEVIEKLSKFPVDELEIAWELLHNRQILLMQLQTELIRDTEEFQIHDKYEKAHNQEVARHEIIQQRHKVVK